MRLETGALLSPAVVGTGPLASPPLIDVAVPGGLLLLNDRVELITFPSLSDLKGLPFYRAELSRRGTKTLC